MNQVRSRQGHPRGAGWCCWPLLALGVGGCGSAEGTLESEVSLGQLEAPLTSQPRVAIRVACTNDGRRPSSNLRSDMTSSRLVTRCFQSVGTIGSGSRDHCFHSGA
jgi:hypothetical protein